MASERRVAGAIISLVNPRDLHETLLMPVVMHGSKKMIWKKKERSKIRAVQMDNLRGSVHLIHKIQSQEQHNNIPNKHYTHWNWIFIHSQ